ncbi:MAG: FAD-binding and (Fe-S)-binding domain-containing protein [bacterium]
MRKSDHQKFATELQRKIRGEVLFDQVSRYLYSTDASLYQIDPIGVVLPRNREEVVQCLRTAAKYGVAILPRGGGTSLAGQTVGRALVLDCSKYMNALLEVNAEARWVRVQPGIVRDELNAKIKPTGLHFTPDVATSSRATVGGMIANNSAGTHSIVYGKTVDQVISLRAILADGNEVEFKELTPAEYEQKCAQDDLEGSIYRETRRLVEHNAEEIRLRFPKVMRRAGGYNLDLLLGEKNWNLAKIVAGSEGTLAFVIEAKVRIEPLPKATGVLVAHFHDLFDALRAVLPVLPHRPAAVELLDRPILHMAAQNLALRPHCTFVEGDPAGVLLIEFFGETSAEIAERVVRLEEEMRSQHKAYVCTRALTAEEQARVWYVRKAGLGLLMGMKGELKPVEFIEDAAVPVEVMPQYLREVADLIQRHNREVTMYAHASVGLVHVRTRLNLKQEEDVKIMRRISEATLDLVLKYGGMMSGEHGDGLVRSYLNPKFFGPSLYQTFRELKRVFDPQGLMNPGKIVDAQSIEENLRIGPHYRTRHLHTHFHYDEDGGFDRAVEMCTGVGECRKTLGGTMCPSYMVTRDEEHSTRGRANALRAALTGKISLQQFTNPRLYEVFDLCLACKACKAECPSNVDMAKLKYEFLQHYFDEHGAPLTTLLFSRPDVLGKLASPLARAVNALLRSKTMRAALHGLFGIDYRRILPLYATESFAHWFDRHQKNNGNHSERPAVVLFNDTFLTYHEPAIGTAAVRVLEALGYRVVLANAGCCGRAQISNGLLRAARPRAEAIVEHLAKFVDAGIPIVGCEPSCVSAVKEDYPDFVREVQTAKRVAGNFFLIEEFVLREQHQQKFNQAFQPQPRNVLYHGHCHLKALFGTASSKAALTQAAGCTVTEVDSGCCGMAGAFGYEKKHYDISMKIGERRLFPAVQALPEDHHIVANGFSCRHQIEHATGRKARHAIELLADALK